MDFKPSNTPTSDPDQYSGDVAVGVTNAINTVETELSGSVNFTTLFIAFAGINAIFAFLGFLFLFLPGINIFIYMILIPLLLLANLIMIVIGIVGIVNWFRNKYFPSGTASAALTSDSTVNSNNNS